ncbi:MAG: HlyD family efflux transporter periplasmic adaptor subunit [Isosphaeraceae bacterium]
MSPTTTAPAPPESPAPGPKLPTTLRLRRQRVQSPLPALRLVNPPSMARRFAWYLAIALAACGVALFFVPWRQSVYGYGRVIAKDPIDRETRVESPIYGRVQEWFVSEASEVQGPVYDEGGNVIEPGSPIARISDNDSEFLAALKAQKAAAEAKLSTAEEEVKLYDSVVVEFRSMLEQALEGARNDIEAGKAKVDALIQEQQAIDAQRKNQENLKNTYNRLTPQGLASGIQQFEYEAKFLEVTAKFAKAKADIAGARSDVASKEAKREEISDKLTAEIRKAEAEIQKARGKVAEATKELTDISIKIRRQETQLIRAPRSGRILRLLANPHIEQLKDGDPIAVLIPDARELAVELFLDGNDIPLVHNGDPVRLQFEGWPAVQFVGWPSAAVGTFGGRVLLADATDNGKGKFRIVVIPEKSCCRDRTCTIDEVGGLKDKDCWPDRRYLRQGVRTKGWTLLRDVPLWWEVWRRINGFPITVADAEPWAKDPGGKKGKDDGSFGVEEKPKDKKIKLPK